MRKLILSLGISLMFLLSCSTSNEELNADKTDRVSVVLKEKNESAQRLMYKMLSPTEKQSIWVGKIDKLLMDGNLNKEQKGLLVELKEKLSTKIFDEVSNNDKKEIFKVIYVKGFLERAKQKFTDDVLYSTFYSINGKRGVDYPISGGDGQDNCTCKKGAIFTCGIGTGVECGDAECKVLPDGCGFMFIHECDGRCKL